jgi:hypothetical protein
MVSSGMLKQVVYIVTTAFKGLKYHQGNKQLLHYTFRSYGRMATRHKANKDTETYNYVSYNPFPSQHPDQPWGPLGLVSIGQRLLLQRTRR